MEPIGRASALHVEIRAVAIAGLGLDSLELGVIGARNRLVQKRRKAIADGVGQHEVTIGETLHQRTRPESVGAVIREVCLARRVQTRNARLQFVVDPQPTHRVVRGRIDAHRHVVGVLAGDALVHFKEVAVALLHHVATKAIDRGREVEVDTVLQRPNTLTFVNESLGGTRRDVARGKVSVRRI